MIEKLHNVLPKIAMISVEAIVKKSLEDHLIKADKLLQWVEKENKFDPLSQLLDIEQAFSLMLTDHDPKERSKQWFIDKAASLGREKSKLQEKIKNFNVLKGIEVEHSLKHYVNAIQGELGFMLCKKLGENKDNEEKTLKFMKIVDGIKYHK